jgi:hypothetical protein
LAAEGCTVLRYPLENEYTVLLRVVGPFFGYLACYELVRCLAGGSLAALEEGMLRRVFMKSEDAARVLAKEDVGLLSQGFHVIAGSPLSLYGRVSSGTFRVCGMCSTSRTVSSSSFRWRSGRFGC